MICAQSSVVHQAIHLHVRGTGSSQERDNLVEVKGEAYGTVVTGGLLLQGDGLFTHLGHALHPVVSRLHELHAVVDDECLLPIYHVEFGLAAFILGHDPGHLSHDEAHAVAARGICPLLQIYLASLSIRASYQVVRFLVGFLVPSLVGPSIGDTQQIQRTRGIAFCIPLLDIHHVGKSLCQGLLLNAQLLSQCRYHHGHWTGIVTLRIVSFVAHGGLTYQLQVGNDGFGCRQFYFGCARCKGHLHLDQRSLLVGHEAPVGHEGVTLVPHPIVVGTQVIYLS